MAESESTWYGDLWDSISSPQSLISLAGGLYAASQAGKGGGSAPTGYQGGIPTLTAVRQQVPVYTPPAASTQAGAPPPPTAPSQMYFDPNRRPGSGGRRYFTDIQYVSPGTTQTGERETTVEDAIAMIKEKNPNAQATEALISETMAANPMTPIIEENLPVAQRSAAEQAQELARFNELNPARAQRMAKGGIASLREGRYLRGETDGMADKVPASIEGKQPALLSDGEFVIPADVVSHLGNGNSEAGAKVLQQMLARIRKERTGNPKQGKQINPDKIIPA